MHHDRTIRFGIDAPHDRVAYCALLSGVGVSPDYHVSWCTCVGA